jgi:hypothetical protein
MAKTIGEHCLVPFLRPRRKFILAATPLTTDCSPLDAAPPPVPRRVQERAPLVASSQHVCNTSGPHSSHHRPRLMPPSIAASLSYPHPSRCSNDPTCVCTNDPLIEAASSCMRQSRSDWDAQTAADLCATLCGGYVPSQREQVITHHKDTSFIDRYGCGLLVTGSTPKVTPTRWQKNSSPSVFSIKMGVSGTIQHRLLGLGLSRGNLS